MRNSIWNHIDKWLLLTPILIFLIGLTAVFSAAGPKSGYVFETSLAMKQSMWMIVALLLTALFMKYSYFKLKDFAWMLYGLAIFLLVLVFFMPARLGAHRWIGVGVFSIQPSELAKFAVMLMLASYFSDTRIEQVKGWAWFKPFLIVFIPFLLILKEPDLGTGLLLLPPFVAMLYLWGVRARWIAGAFFGMLLMTPVFFPFLKDYQKPRLLVFMNPNADPLGAGYTIIQSKIAIGSGGLWGKGLMGGTQNKLRFLPESHTDFIFGVLAEEGGFVLSALIVALFAVIIHKGLNISRNASDRFGSMLALGITSHLCAQTVINLGMTMGLLPVVGVPLCLVSYGGTSLLVTFLFIGLLANIKHYNKFI